MGLNEIIVKQKIPHVQTIYALIKTVNPEIPDGVVYDPTLRPITMGLGSAGSP